MVGVGEVDGFDEIDLEIIMVTDAARAVTATSRTIPKPANIQAFRRELAPRPLAGRLMHRLPWQRLNRVIGPVFRSVR